MPQPLRRTTALPNIFAGSRTDCPQQQELVRSTKLAFMVLAVYVVIKEQQHLATYSWLAESTGWAESETYTDPNIKQSIANHNLCDLQGGVDGEYENNIASASYGGFTVPTMSG